MYRTLIAAGIVFTIATVLLTSCGASSDAPALYTGPPPTLYWTFDNETVSGSTVADVMGVSGQSGTVSTDGATVGVPGIAGEAVDLDGSNGTVTGDVPHTNTFTVSLWLRTETYPTGDGLIAVNLDNGPGEWEGWIIGARNSERLAFTVEGGGSTFSEGQANEISAVTSAVVPVSEWIHLAGVMDGGAQEIRIYRDGALQETVTLPYSAINFGNAGLVLGKHSFFDNRYFDGQIDELAIFNDVILSADDIRDIYLVGRDGRAIVTN